MSIENYVRPICLTPIAAKVFESIIIKWLTEAFEDEIDVNKFGGINELPQHTFLSKWFTWYEATDKLDSYVRVVMQDFSKAFDLVNHNFLTCKTTVSCIVRWMATFCFIGQNSTRKKWKLLFAFFAVMTPQKVFINYHHHLKQVNGYI